MSEHPAPRLTPRLIGWLTVAAGAAVANIYYNQSLLREIETTFHSTARAVGAVAVATQAGYASGLLLLIPLGDAMDRRRLLIASGLAAAIMLAVVAAAPSLPVAVAGSYLLGFVAITPQLIIPHAASLADPKGRGRVVGTIMSGVLTGILFSRVVAGFVAGWLGWRAVFAGAAGVTLAVTGGLALLPAGQRPAHPQPYGRLLLSLFHLLRRERLLQRHAVLGALSFGAFSAFWTTVAFYVGSLPGHYGPRTVGTLALFAVAGALMAPIVGRLADRYGALLINGVALSVLALSFLAMGLAGASLIGLALTVFWMDVGAQGNQVANQSRIYTLPPELHSRITSVYMVCYFLGGAAGSALGLQAWEMARWPGVWLTGAATALVGLPVLFAWPVGPKEPAEAGVY